MNTLFICLFVAVPSSTSPSNISRVAGNIRYAAILNQRFSEVNTDLFCISYLFQTNGEMQI